VTYPCRCRIVDADGAPIAPGLQARTPEGSRPHVGKEGLAEDLGDWLIRITLDDGTILYGCDCWWVPVATDTIEDGFGSVWSATCPNCGGKTMQVVRPGKVQCSQCS